MINLEFLAAKLNEMIGVEKYVVYLKTNAHPTNIDTTTNKRNVVVMEASRTSYGYTSQEFDAETLNITLTFDVPTAQNGEDFVTRNVALFDIERALLGWKNFEVEQPNKEQEGIIDTYLVSSMFDLQPSSNPYLDAGRLTQQIVVSGLAHVKNENCQATIGNDVIISINGEDLLKVSRASNLSVGVDNNLPLSAGDTLPVFQGISRVATKTIEFVYTGKEIENEFLLIAEGEDYDVNKVYTYKATYPFGIVEKKVKISSVSTQDSAGVFLRYTLNLQVVKED